MIALVDFVAKINLKAGASSAVSLPLKGLEWLGMCLGWQSKRALYGRQSQERQQRSPRLENHFRPIPQIQAVSTTTKTLGQVLIKRVMAVGNCRYISPLQPLMEVMQCSRSTAIDLPKSCLASSRVSAPPRSQDRKRRTEPRIVDRVEMAVVPLGCGRRNGLLAG